MSAGIAENSEMEVVICEPTKFIPPGISPSIASIISIQPAPLPASPVFTKIMLPNKSSQSTTNDRLNTNDSSKNTTTENSTIISMLQEILLNQSEIKASIRHLQKNVLYIKNRTPIQNTIIDEDGNLFLTNQNFPLNSVAELNDIEERLQDAKYYERMKIHLKTATQGSELDVVFRNVITDQACINYNLDGYAGKLSLNSLTLFRQLLFEICGQGGRKNYERELRKIILRSHNRFHKRKSIDKTKPRTDTSDVQEPDADFEKK